MNTLALQALKWIPGLSPFAVSVIRQGPVPNHIAIIMDGNRRFASQSNLPKQEGHRMGYEKLIDVIGWCKDCGVSVLTVYAFSLENLKRSEEEVSYLMSLALEKFTEAFEKGDAVRRVNMRIKILGDWSAIPARVRAAMIRVMRNTADNDGITVNVCFSYTSRWEIAHSIQLMARGVSEGRLQLCDVSEDLMEMSFETAHEPDPDILIRTSGEVRLSDFLTWQSSFAAPFWLSTLWPAVQLTDILAVLLTYQQQVDALQKQKAVAIEQKQMAQQHADVIWLRQRWEAEPKRDEGRPMVQRVKTLDDRLAQLLLDRDARVDGFLADHQERMDVMFEDSLSYE